MKQIVLTQGKFAIVDDEDYERIAEYKWFVLFGRANTKYAFRSTQKNYLRRNILMHREVMGLSFKDGKQLDHINHDGLDNRKHNLRLCNYKQNQQNRNQQHGKSKYKGVLWSKRLKKWIATIQGNKKRFYLGSFCCERLAARAYDKKAIELFGEFAKTNLQG